MVSASLKLDIVVFATPPKWLPDPVAWDNYLKVWTGPGSLGGFLVNSVVVAAASVLGDLITSALAGYAFARLSFPLRDRVFALFVATAIVPSQLLLIPRFVLFKELGLYDTLWALILPGIFTVFGTFLMRQTFAAMPAELGEGARIDGASEWQIFYRVYLPLARPALAALAILAFVSSWNSYESPLVMLSDPQKMTIPLGLTLLADESGGLSPGVAMAAATSSILPILIVFILAQKHFVAALSRSGIK
jgi:multiple sugar transport system permease protein